MCFSLYIFVLDEKLHNNNDADGKFGADGHSLQFGYGRLNAAEAVAKAKSENT
jgi:hypothetical protein